MVLLAAVSRPGGLRPGTAQVRPFCRRPEPRQDSGALVVREPVAADGAYGEEISLPVPLNFSLTTATWPRWKKVTSARRH